MEYECALASGCLQVEYGASSYSYFIAMSDCILQLGTQPLAII